MSADNYFITDQNAVYFLTFTVSDWVDIFTRKEFKLEIVDSLNYCIQNKGLCLFAWCLMSNHAVLLDNTTIIEQRINYTHENPVRALIVAEPHEYLFSSARDYAGEQGYVNVQVEI